MTGRDFYIWDVQSFTVRLAVDVVDRINAALADPNRNKDEEHGGILLGRIIGPEEAEVTGFEFEPSQHRRGVAYNLGLRERERVAKRVGQLRRARGEVPVGYFRTHMRPGLFLDQDDFSLMGEAFDTPGSVALLINTVFPEVASAGFFFWEGEEIDRRQTRAQFPFDGAALRERDSIVTLPGEVPLEKKPVLVPAWLAWAAACLAAVMGFGVVSLVARQHASAAAPVHLTEDRPNRLSHSVSRGVSPSSGTLVSSGVSVAVSFEPRPATNKQPLLPAQPRAPLTPRIPDQLAARLSRETPVDIRVSIDKNGVVQNTEVLTAGSNTLASLAADNAFWASWKPARQHDEAVPSEMIVHYKFRPASGELP